MAKTVVGNYPANVQARQIIAIGALDSKTNSRVLTLVDGTQVTVTGVMLTAYNPSLYDYYVVPTEGHPYMTPKSSFVQSYTAGDK